MSVAVPQSNFFKFRPGFLLAATIRPDPDTQRALRVPGIIVFETRITSNFEVEQVGSGFPCGDEHEAMRIAKIIESKNQTVPYVALASWSGGFALVTLSSPEMSWEEIHLFCYHKAQIVDGAICKYSLRYFTHFLGKPPEMTKEEMLPTTDPAGAKSLLQQKLSELAGKERIENQLATPAGEDPNESAALRESQMIVLSRGFPEAIELLKSKIPQKPGDVYAAYQRDIFGLTGKMFEPLTFNQEQFWKSATAAGNRRRRKKKGIDPLEYEIVAGWYFRGYGRMTPEERRAELNKRGFSTASAESVRKLCQKLKLPSLRKPGFH